MKNISLSDFESKRLHKVDNIEAFTYDHHILYAIARGLVFKSQGDDEEVICNLTESLYTETDEDSIPKALQITYSCEKDLLYVIFVNGDIVSVNADKHGCVIGSVEHGFIVGSVDGGIKCSQWSPEQEVIALVTGFFKVIVMTNEFEPISEVDLHDRGFGEKQFITVGWGKKETQFRGSEGKLNFAEKKNEEVAVESNDSIEISWRGDAEYFVVTSLNPDTHQRYLRIFSKSGILQYTSENLNGLESCLDWRPSGDLIAGVQKLPNKYSVCFFEKNGLKHGEFELPFNYNNFKVHKIFWSKDSKILSVLVSKIAELSVQSKMEFQSVSWSILLYSVSNYHWYLKHRIDFDKNSTPCLMFWDPQNYNTLHLVVKKEKCVYHYKYSWLWVINKNRCGYMKNESLVAVIDGNDLLITSFRRGIIPPPMCSHRIHFPVAVNAVSFGPNDNVVSPNNIVVLLCDNSLYVYKFIESGDFNQIAYEFIGKTNELNNDFEINYNVQWVSSSLFMLCNVKITNNKSLPFLNILDITEMCSVLKFKKREILLNSTVSLLRAWQSLVIIHNNDGKLYKIDIIKNEVADLFESDKKTLIDFEIAFNKNENLCVFSLDNLNKFYINNRILFSNILSFHIHENFVLLTSLKHQLLCFDFEIDVQNNNEVSQLFTRRVERGSKIITSVKKDVKVILQMPRGNLECIQPRVLSLSVLKNYLNCLNYYEAFDLMRKQRINLNLIYDHNPELFCKNLNTFIEQIKDPLWINLFISELCEEDVTKTMYSTIYTHRVHNENITELGSKINNVCEMIEKALLNKENTESYILSIFTCYIKRGDIKYLETALLKLKELKEKQSKGFKLAVTFDEAFKYLLYLIEVNELYKVALGLYDFDLALMIANKSQKDPKEYVPFLNDLKKLESNYQKFTVDKYLKRNEKALKNLVLCDGDDVFNECLNFIKVHKLYKQALKLIPQNTDRYKNICFYYAEELIGSCFYEEAAIMYMNAGKYKNALEAYKKSGNWQEVISCGKELKLSQNELNELYINLAMDLNEKKNFKEASIIYLDYLHDVEECVKTLSNGKLYAEAYRITDLHDRNDLINIVIVPKILEQGSFLEFQITDYRDTFIKQKNRLQVVKKQKMEAIQNKEYLDGDDAFSEASTVITHSLTSQLTNKTYKSAKNRRKQERKLLSLKEGSPYEDLALITSLHNLVASCENLKLELKELNKFLVKLKNYELAEKLQNKLENLLKTIEISKSEIWTPDLLRGKQSYGPDTTSNDISALYMTHENNMPVSLNPKFTIPPETQINIKWKLEFLGSQ